MIADWVRQLTLIQYGDIMTLEELLQEVADRGLRVNNLFQRGDGTWQCNLRQDKPDNWVCCAWALAPTAQLAVLEALTKPLDVPGIKVQEVLTGPVLRPLSLKDIGLKRHDR